MRLRIITFGSSSDFKSGVTSNVDWRQKSIDLGRNDFGSHVQMMYLWLLAGIWFLFDSHQKVHPTQKTGIGSFLRIVPGMVTWRPDIRARVSPVAFCSIVFDEDPRFYMKRESD